MINAADVRALMVTQDVVLASLFSDISRSLELRLMFPGEKEATSLSSVVRSMKRS